MVLRGPGAAGRRRTMSRRGRETRRVAWVLGLGLAAACAERSLVPDSGVIAIKDAGPSIGEVGGLDLGSAADPNGAIPCIPGQSMSLPLKTGETGVRSITIGDW